MPLDPANPRDVARCPGHHRVCVREDHLTTAIFSFLDKYVLGHDRAAMLETLLPRTAADAAAKGLITELAQLGDDASPARVAYRDRIREHFTTLIDQIPYAPGLATAPDHVRAALYAALDLHCTYRADKNQVTIRAAITDTTLGITETPWVFGYPVGFHRSMRSAAMTARCLAGLPNR